ncbi:MAG: hypothetical protein H5T47_06135, partial [Archaeoglobi archaeon]|nr:hypothetical protein [Candidatus Mnemosynella bozhongmuii]
MEEEVKKRDVFTPVKRVYRLNFASAKLLSLKISEILSPEGKYEVDDKTNSILVVDAKKFLEKVEEIVKKEDSLEKSLLPPLSFEQKPLSEVLSKVSEISGVNIIWDTIEDEKVTARFEKPLPLLKALSFILSPHGYEYRVEDGVIRIKKSPQQFLTKT